ncbi:c-5 cytosine methyltransferase [Diplodia corticola]|uniref:DNA (cytosine-5-)-methyltransferase n=1 Tax=Diplodia corticola TaxID=236234 RepID=A0A1J9S5L4_9PEZI|nr:c-5 cytosine methyltransferase [Diplodia corticola]OJD35236.1 c-5 cytosine methyltransferase [Diplodia corticola]
MESTERDFNDDDDLTPPSAALRDFIIIDDEDEDASLSPEASIPQEARARPAPTRNQPPTWPEEYITSCTLIGEEARARGPTASTIRMGDTVEVMTTQPNSPVRAGDFIRVMKIVENTQSGRISLRGLLFRRNRYLQPMLPRKLNEVYLFYTIDENDPRPYFVQGTEEIQLEDVLQKRRLIVTQHAYPALSFRDHTHFHSDHSNAEAIRDSIEGHDVLVCRHMFAYIYGEGERHRARRRPHQGLLRHISSEEADAGDGILTGKSAVHINLEDSDDDDVTFEHNMRHGPNRLGKLTFGDAFQGGGGASCAAKLAGLKVVWGFDHDAPAVTTALHNFRRARIVHCEAADFPPRGFDPKCDILHLSPPCQAFSPANTSPNARRDEANTDALFTVGPIIRAAKPRIATLEETFGLLTRERHTQWFGILLNMIYDAGYSIRWSIMNTLEYGVPQPRKRLALVAAAPGIPLPDFPKPTHGELGSGLPGFVSVREAIGNIPRTTANHDPMSARQIFREPWDPSFPFNRTIMTSNSDVYHWSGRRRFTNRELAGIQGFPHSHNFFGSHSQIEKQIGNAVPPSWFKLILEECVKVLRKVDRKEGRGARDDENGGETDMSSSRTLLRAPSVSFLGPTGGSAENPIVIIDDNIIDLD